MSFLNSNIRPAHLPIEMALRELHIEQLNNSSMVDREDDDDNDNAIIFDVDDESLIASRSIDERVLAPRISSMENSINEHINTSVPSLDEIIIRQRGRQKKKPAKISWSPIKSPFKTPTKINNRTLSPSPAKKNFHNTTTSMILRNSPRKRIFSADPDLTSSSTPIKKLRFVDESPIAGKINSDVALKTLLKGLSNDQLIEVICGISNRDSNVEKEIRKNLPLPDIRPLEEELCTLRRYITKSSPRSRLSMQSKTDGAAYSRALTHLSSFKKAISNHCKLLSDSLHFDALIDYILIAWTYVRGLPIWDEPSHNLMRKECFKLLTLHAKNALKNGDISLGTERIRIFRSKIKSMMNDFDEIEKCKEALNMLATRI